MTDLRDVAPYFAALAIWVGGMAALNLAFILRDRLKGGTR